MDGAPARSGPAVEPAARLSSDRAGAATSGATTSVTRPEVTASSRGMSSAKMFSVS